MTQAGATKAVETGSFYLVLSEKAVELSFAIGRSGMDRIDFEKLPTSQDEFIKGLVALVVEEVEANNISEASKIAGLLADYYSRDVLVLDAQLRNADCLVGEMHFIDGPTRKDRVAEAEKILRACLQPASNGYLH